MSRWEREPQFCVPNRRVVDSGNEGCPGGTLVPAVDVRHFQFCTKRHRYHAGRFQSFTCFTRALHAADHEDPIHFTVNGFSAGSYTGAVIALAIRCLWPASQTTARLGAIAMPKSVFAALVATAEPDKLSMRLKIVCATGSQPRRSLVCCNNPCTSRM